MKRRAMLALLLAATLAALCLPAAARAECDPPAARTDAGIRAIIENYVSRFNARDVEGILALYDPQARIRMSADNGGTYISPAEYRPRLTEKMEGYERKGTQIYAFEIGRLDVSGCTAGITINLKVKQSIFRVTRSGFFELAKVGDGWRIVKDEM